MKVLSIAKKIILRSLRDVNTMLIMCAMPLVIIFILGMVFNSLIGNDSSIELDDMYITYTVIGERTQISDGIEDMMHDLLTENSTYEMTKDKDEQIKKLRAADITAFIQIDEDNKTVTLYKNSRVNTSSSILESALRSFTAKYNTIVEVAKVNPTALQAILSQDETGEYIQKIGLNKKYQPSAMDYYGVAITALFILYGFLTPLVEIIIDRKEGLTTRVLTTSVKPVEIFTGNVLGYVSVTSIRTAIVIVISTLAYGINWGAAPIFPILLLFALIVVMTSLGMMLGEIFKSLNTASSAGHLFIVMSGFFGGAYIALEDMGNIASIGKYLSLIWWTNTGISNQIYNNDYSNMITAFIIFGVLSVVFLGVSIVLMNKREAFSNE